MIGDGFLGKNPAIAGEGAKEPGMIRKRFRTPESSTICYTRKAKCAIFKAIVAGFRGKVA